MNEMWWILLIIIVVVVPVLGSVLKKARAGSEKYQQIMADFQQKVQAMLDADEQVEAMCGYKPCAAVTNKRLLVSAKEGVDVVPFAQIKKLHGMNSSGNNTKYPAQMLVFQIKADKKYTLGNHSDGFEQVVERLYHHTGL